MGGSRISGKGVHMYKGVGVRFADFISFFLNIPWTWNNLVTLRPNYFIFIGYFKSVGREGVQAIPLNPLWFRHWIITQTTPTCWWAAYFYFFIMCHVGNTCFLWRTNVWCRHELLLFCMKRILLSAQSNKRLQAGAENPFSRWIRFLAQLDVVISPFDTI